MTGRAPRRLFSALASNPSARWRLVPDSVKPDTGQGERQDPPFDEIAQAPISGGRDALGRVYI